MNGHSMMHRHKSHTLQPADKSYLIQKYLESQKNQANYANVPLDPVAPVPLGAATHHHQQNYHHHQQSRVSHQSRSHNQHLHSRSHSQHYYQTTFPVNDYHNNYYNITPGMARSRHSPLNEPPPQLLSVHNAPAQLDCITVMQVCNALGNNIDSCPTMPEARQYSILRAGSALIKVDYPQTRTMGGDYRDPRTKLYIKAGEPISVLGPSKEDRSKVTICYRDRHCDLPHQLTVPTRASWS